jgi:virginiamycin B lyase
MTGPSRHIVTLVCTAAVLAISTACTGDPPPTPQTTPTTDATTPAATGSATGELELQSYPVPAGSHPHDVAPALDGGVWFTGQRAGYLGHLNPANGTVTQIPLGNGSAPHGVIIGPDGAAWITDGGLNAIVRVDASTRAVKSYPLPANRPNANLNTATFDNAGILWFTGQAGVYGRLDPATGAMQVFDAPRGRGPYGITTTPSGDVYYASLAGNHIARIDLATAAATVLEPPTAGQGARRVWSDSTGRIWVSEYNAGRVGRYDPGTNQWTEWPLPGGNAKAYSVYVDDRDLVWLTDFTANTIVRFDPVTETFTTVNLPGPNAAVRQMLGRPGEAWGAASGLDLLVVVRSSP